MKPQMQRIKNEKLTIQQEINLIEDYQSGSKATGHSLAKLTEHYKGLVSKTSRPYIIKQPFGAGSEDIISDGNLGLINGLKRYDATREIKPSTYLIQRIRGQILDGMRTRMDNHHGPIRIIPRINRERNNFFTKNGRYPTEKELSKITGISLSIIIDCNAGQSSTISGNTTSEEDTKESLFDILENSNSGNPSVSVEQDQATQYLQKLFDSAHEDRLLTNRESMIFSLYHLIEDELTLKEIGEIYDLSESRICQIMGETMKKLKKRATTIQHSTIEDFI